MSEPMPHLTLRDFTPGDYPAVVRIANSIHTEYPLSEEEFRFRDRSKDPKCLFHRWLATVGGEVLAYGEYDQQSMMYHPRKFTFDIEVQPDSQGQGIGRILYERIREALSRFDPLVLRCMVREDKTPSVRFLADRGFEEDRRLWESRLDPSGFDLAPFEGQVESVLAQGIEIRTYRDLQDDPEHLRRLGDLDWEATQDVPLSEPATRMPDDVYNKTIAENPSLLPDAFFIALDQGQYVGLSNLWSSQGNDDLYTGFTGTARAYRHRGIALALKLRAVVWAKERGCRCLKTWNDSSNRPMLAINEGMGFVKQPVWILFKKVLKAEGE